MLVFNRHQTLIGISRSVRGASELTGCNLQSVSHACVGRIISSGGFYFRHIHPDIEIELSDLGELKLQEYDDLCCDTDRKYNSASKMEKEYYRKFNKNNQNEEN